MASVRAFRAVVPRGNAGSLKRAMGVAKEGRMVFSGQGKLNGMPTIGRSVLRAQLLRRGQTYGWLEKHYWDKERREALEARWASDPALPPCDDSSLRPKAFLEFSVGNKPAGRVVVELAADILPKTCDNFLKLCEGHKGKAFGKERTFGYRGSKVHQLWKENFLMMGDMFTNDGRGGHSALGTRFFEDEGFFVQHTKPGLLSMAQSSKDQNSSIFFFTLKPLPHLNGRNVCFGAVVEGMDVLNSIATTFQVKGKPIEPIKIMDCGIINKE